MADTLFTSCALNRPLSEINAPSTNITPSNSTDAVAAISGPLSYKLTSVNGGESTPSSEFNFIGDGSGVSVSFDLVTGATDYRLYRSASGENNYFLVANSTGSPILDLNEISGAAPPTENTTSHKSRSMGTSPTVFYEVTGDYRTLVKEILVNSSLEDGVLFDVYFVPSGESPSYGNALLYNISLEQNETKIFSLNTVLEAGDSIQAASSVIGTTVGYGIVNLKISGIEITE